MVYVLDMEGKPLMPTTRHGWARRALKSGRAKAVQTLPFTIRLQYSLDDPVLQDITLGIDPGRTNIGVAAVREDGTPPTAKPATGRSGNRWMTAVCTARLHAGANGSAGSAGQSGTVH